MINRNILRLKQHSGLYLPGEEIPVDTLAEFLFQIRQGGVAPKLDEVTADIVACLDALNQELHDFESTNQPLSNVDGGLVYAISGIVSASLDKALELLRSDATSNLGLALLDVVWTVQVAWDVFLAGDIEDLPGHVSGEKAARVGDGPIIG
jgi:hypothetical protein